MVGGENYSFNYKINPQRKDSRRAELRQMTYDRQVTGIVERQFRHVWNENARLLIDQDEPGTFSAISCWQRF